MFDASTVDLLISKAGVQPHDSAETPCPICAGEREPGPLTAEAKLEIAGRLSASATNFLVSRRWQEDPEPDQLVNQLEEIHHHIEALRTRLRAIEQPCQARYRFTAQAASESRTDTETDMVSGAARVDAAIRAVGELERWSRTAIQRDAHRYGLIYEKQGKKGLTGVWKYGVLPLPGLHSTNVQGDASMPGRLAEIPGLVKKKAGGRDHDEAMQDLINTLAEIWLDSWHRPPGAAITTNTQEPGGPFIRFVQTFRDELLARLSPEDHQQDPGLRRALSISASGIRKRARNCPVAKLARFTSTAQERPDMAVTKKKAGG